MEHFLDDSHKGQQWETARLGKLSTYPDQPSADLGNGLILRQSDVGDLRRVAGDARVRVAEQVGLPLPARSVRMSRADVLGL